MISWNVGIKWLQADLEQIQLEVTPKSIAQRKTKLIHST
jgi:hypothetical protein